MVTIFRASTVAEADIVAAWLDGQGILAFVKDRFMAETMPAPWIVAPKGIGVCVAERDADRARELLEEHRRELDRKKELDRTSPIHAICETCRQVRPFAQAHAGTLQRCSECGAEVEVPEV